MRGRLILTFGEWELDQDQWELRHRGRVVPLQPKPFAVLLHLARNRHRVVPTDELLAEVWRGVRVTPNSVMRAIYMIRRALGSEASVVRTQSRRGYRFAVTVVERWAFGCAPAPGTRGTADDLDRSQMEWKGPPSMYAPVDAP
jgi:DNA-binding winged helix-turn-helix (wHTH) protein